MTNSLLDLGSPAPAVNALSQAGALENWDSVLDWVKAANIGGDPQSGFEQSLANLAYSYISDSAPRLLDFMVGFQLVDRNEDNTKAMGLFGFNVSGDWVYAPIFFLNGDLKGNELLYLKAQDKFVPLKENWVNYILGRQNHSLGEGMQETPQQMGVRQPNLRPFSTPPATTKYSCQLRHDLAAGIRSQLATWITTNPYADAKYAGLDERLSLREFLRQDLSLVKAAVELTDRYPLLDVGLRRLHGDLLREVLLDMQKQAQRSWLLGDHPTAHETAQDLNVLGEPKAAQAVDPGQKVRLHVCDYTKLASVPPRLSADQEARLIRGGYIIEDERGDGETSTAYEVDMRLNLRNPDTSGRYDVLTEVGEYSRCLLLCNPHAGDGRRNMVTVIRLDGGKNWVNANRNNVFLREVDNPDETRETYEKYLDGLSEKESLTDNAVYVAIGIDGTGSVPFRVLEKAGDGAYRVHFFDSISHDYDRPDYLPPVQTDLDRSRTAGPYYSSRMPEMVQFNYADGAHIRSLGNTLLLPPDVKIIKLRDADDYCCGSSENPPIRLGNLEHLTAFVRRKTAMLRLYADGSEVHINQQRFPKLAGLLHLMRDHGFTEDVATTMLKRAEKNGGAAFRIKYAEPYPRGVYETGQGVGAPPIPDANYTSDPGFDMGAQVQYPQTDFQQVPELQSQNYDRNVYNPNQNTDPQAMQVAQQAAQSGQREVFDTAMISGMLKAVREQSLIDRYLGDLMTALDRLGRILFMLFWHHDDFTDRFGKADMPELEDTLRNSFENLGELVLFLKLKSVDHNPGELLGSPNLQHSARN